MNYILKKPQIFLIFMAFFCCTIVNIAEARFLGNPVTDAYKDKINLGFSISGTQRAYDLNYTNKYYNSSSSFEGDYQYSQNTIFVDYGLGGYSSIRLEIGSSTVGYSGTGGYEFGVGYRDANDKATVLMEKPARLGYFADAHYGSLTGGSTFELEGGYGASIKIKKWGNVYFAGILNYHTLTVENSYEKYELTSKNLIGGIFGYEHDLASFKGIQIGFEYHLLYESGFAYYIKMKL